MLPSRPMFGSGASSRSIYSASIVILVSIWTFFYLFGSFHHVQPEPVEPVIEKQEETTPLPQEPIDPERYTGWNYPSPLPGTNIGQASIAPDSRPVISYAYFESDFARRNLEFFVQHGLHDAADFIFILNGETDVDETIIFNPKIQANPKRDLSNVMVRRRRNECFDLGSHTEVLSSVVGGEGWFNAKGAISAPVNAPQPYRLPGPDEEEEKKLQAVEAADWKANNTNKYDSSAPLPLTLRMRYKKFILMNASIRGPFVPAWSGDCWSNSYLSKVTKTNKLVGMSYNCHNNRGHVQSMIWATDRTGLDVITSTEGVGLCFDHMVNAINAEIESTRLLRDAGYTVDAFMSVFHSKGKAAAENEWWKDCNDEDYLWTGKYYGTNLHPYENLFMKSHREIDDVLLDRLTVWHDGAGYESWDVCH